MLAIIPKGKWLFSIRDAKGKDKLEGYTEEFVNGDLDENRYRASKIEPQREGTIYGMSEN